MAELCRKYGIAELSVFGSVARGEEREDSDIDLLYVRAPGNDLGMAYFELQEELEDLLGRPVDLVSKGGLHWVIRDRVLADARVLYEAAWKLATDETPKLEAQALTILRAEYPDIASRFVDSAQDL